MIRIVFPYILFVSLVSLAGGVLNVYRRFAIPAFTPVLLNLSVIGAAIFLARIVDPPITRARVGRGDRRRRAAASRRFVRCWRSGMLPKPGFDWRDEGVRRVLLAMGPAVIGVSAAQISALINTQLAALLGDGRISWITLCRPPDGVSERAARRGTRARSCCRRLRSITATRTSEQYSALLDWGCASPCCSRCRRPWRCAILALPLVTTLVSVRPVHRRRRHADARSRCSATASACPR